MNHQCDLKETDDEAERGISVIVLVPRDGKEQRRFPYLIMSSSLERLG